MADMQKMLALVVGAILSLAGVAGYFTGSSLLGFGINTLHNLVHLVTGVLGVIVGMFTAGSLARNYNRGLGVVYVVVAVLGFVLPALMTQLLNINTADNLLHLVLGVVLAGVGFGTKD